MENGKTKTILQLIAAILIGGFGYFVLANKTLGNLEAATSSIATKVIELKDDLIKHEGDVSEHRESTEDKIERIRKEFEVLSRPMLVQLEDIEDKIDEANKTLKEIQSSRTK
jgi:hypothetical protein